MIPEVPYYRDCLADPPEADLVPVNELTEPQMVQLLGGWDPLLGAGHKNARQLLEAGVRNRYRDGVPRHLVAA